MFRSQLDLEDRIMAQQSNCVISLLWWYIATWEQATYQPL